MKLLLPLLIFLSINFSFAQYQPLKSEGTIPKDFITPTYIKYEKEKENVDRGAKRRTRKNQKEFYLESNYGIDDLLKSGYVLFNDPVSTYVNEVVDVLLQDEPKLRKKLRFYVVRTPAVNAFATGQGVILVNMGLISQLQNEAQLAFILAHEISHYKEDHALEFYLEAKDLDQKNNRGFLKRKSFDTQLAKNNFSKEQETEADELGLEIFLKSNYDLESVNGAFDVLQYSYLPFGNEPFNKSYFEDDYLLFKPSYQLDSINAINADPTEDDSESTHPSLPKRRTAARDIIGKTAQEGRQEFIISKDRFFELRKIARYELLEYHLRSYEFYDAIYNAFLLQKEFPNDKYLKKIIGKALYGMMKFRNARKFNDLELDEDKIEGELGSLVYFFNKLKKFELNVLALRYTYLLNNEFADDPTWELMVEDICQDYINKHKGTLKRFKKGKPMDSLPSVEIEYPGDEAPQAEKDAYEEALKEQKEKTEGIYVYHAFGDLMGQPEFDAMMERCKKNKGKKKRNSDFRDEDFWDNSKKKKNGDFALGKKKILVINPFYLKLKKGFKKPLLIQTEKSQEAFINNIEKNADRLKLKTIILDPSQFGKKDIEEFNDLQEVQEWFSHQMEMDEDLNMIAFNQNRINSIAEKYGVDAFVWAGVVTGKIPKNLYLGYFKLLFNQISWIYGVVAPKGESIIFSLVMDTETGNSEMSTFDLISFIDHKDVLTQRVYDLLWQINRKPKK